MVKLNTDWPVKIIQSVFAVLPSCMSISLFPPKSALTHPASKVLDVIKVIWPCFNHWENWAAPHNPTLEGDKIQSLIRVVIDWCNLIGCEAVEGMWLIAFVHYTCWSWLAILLTFICYLISMWSSQFTLPIGVPLGPVPSRVGAASPHLIQHFQNSLSNYFTNNNQHKQQQKYRKENYQNKNENRHKHWNLCSLYAFKSIDLYLN